jgi:hypothetical protein
MPAHIGRDGILKCRGYLLKAADAGWPAAEGSSSRGDGGQVPDDNQHTMRFNP